ncbi:hypothetical protein GH714_010510 [Hevea brasiliensis]|uniref:Uncharacterized protein n=1 Tax=Hevea brasiliensis TaxID=3981 RepID=A0A6A6MYV8_HEVBR|nr:hypothetical protein GH714_010510 [Hevea brasiliensis]
MMEREMAMRVGIRDGGLSSEERLTMRLEQGAWFPCVNQFDNRRLEDRSAFHGHGVSINGQGYQKLWCCLMLSQFQKIIRKLIVLLKWAGQITCAAWHVNNYNIEIVMGHWILASMSGTQVDVMWAVLG